MDDSYLTIRDTGTSEYRDRGSRFIGVAIPVSAEDEAMAAVGETRSRWHDARHHCFAFRTGHPSGVYRSNDDGEPSGTAGAPILQQIESRGLTDTLVVVTRYFGGTRLGRGGLARAYGSAAGGAIDAAGLTRRVLRDRLKIRFAYDDTARAMHVIESFSGRIESSEYSDATVLLVAVRRSLAEDFRRSLTDALGGRIHVEHVVKDG